VTGWRPDSFAGPQPQIIAATAPAWASGGRPSASHRRRGSSADQGRGTQPRVAAAAASARGPGQQPSRTRIGPRLVGGTGSSQRAQTHRPSRHQDQIPRPSCVVTHHEGPQTLITENGCNGGGGPTASRAPSRRSSPPRLPRGRVGGACPPVTAATAPAAGHRRQGSRRWSPPPRLPRRPGGMAAWGQATWRQAAGPRHSGPTSRAGQRRGTRTPVISGRIRGEPAIVGFTARIGQRRPHLAR